MRSSSCTSLRAVRRSPDIAREGRWQQAAADLIANPCRHHDVVQQDQVGRRGDCAPEGTLAVVGHLDAVALLAQQAQPSRARLSACRPPPARWASGKATAGGTLGRLSRCIATPGGAGCTRWGGGLRGNAPAPSGGPAPVRRQSSGAPAACHARPHHFLHQGCMVQRWCNRAAGSSGLQQVPAGA